MILYYIDANNGRFFFHFFPPSLVRVTHMRKCTYIYIIAYYIPTNNIISHWSRTIIFSRTFHGTSIIFFFHGQCIITVIIGSSMVRGMIFVYRIENAFCMYKSTSPRNGIDCNVDFIVITY